MKKHWFASAVIALAWGVALFALVFPYGDTVLGLFGSAQAASMEGELAITEWVPSSASNDLDTPIVITGTNFITGAEAFLGATSLDNVKMAQAGHAPCLDRNLRCRFGDGWPGVEVRIWYRFHQLGRELRGTPFV